MPAKIIDLALGPPNPVHQPIEVTRLAFWAGGLDVSPAMGRIPFADVAGFAVFRKVSGEPACWLLFFRGRPSAFCVSLDNVDFAAVQGLDGRQPVEKLRAVLLFLAKRDAQVVIDRSTVSFLKGQPPVVFPHQVSVLAAAFLATLHDQGPAAAPRPTPAQPPANARLARAPGAAPVPLAVPRPPAPPPATATPAPPAPVWPAPPPQPGIAAPAAPSAPQTPGGQAVSGSLRATPSSRTMPRPAPPPRQPPRPAPSPGLRSLPRQTRKLPWMWILGGLAGGAVLLFVLVVGMSVISRAAKMKRPPTALTPRPPPIAFSYGLSRDIPDVLHWKYPDVERALREALGRIHRPGPGALNSVLEDKKKIEDLGIQIVTRKAEFFVHYIADEERLSLRIDFVGEVQLSERDEFRYLQALRFQTSDEGEVPLRRTNLQPYTAAFDLRSRGGVGIAEIVRDGDRKALIKWGESSPEAGKLDISKVRAVASSPEVLFEHYVSLEHMYEISGVDLFANSAKIHNVRRHPGGRVEEFDLTGAQYKKLILATTALAAARGDTNTYSDVTFTPEGAGQVRVNSTRFSELKKYSSPLSILAARQEGGYWLIVEELSESRP